jgi:hypothetical protein
MKWVKLGLVFDPTEHQLPNGCTEYAQSPQALVFENFVRVYFSTRAKDPSNGKYLSHIAYVEMTKDLSLTIGVSTSAVISLGRLGCFDEHGIFPMNVLRVDGKIFGYTSGWSRRVSVSVETSIGLAFSRNDGVTFERIGDGPILTSSLTEPFLVGDPFVLKQGDQFHMWYIFGTNWLEGEVPERVYKIGHAISPDGISWLKDQRNIIADKLGESECQALPSVVHFKGVFHMVFCYREATDFRINRERGYRLGYAYSFDLINWIRDDSQVMIDASPNDWDSDMRCYPHLFVVDGKLHLLYNGNQFGRFGFGLAVATD